MRKPKRENDFGPKDLESEKKSERNRVGMKCFSVKKIGMLRRARRRSGEAAYAKIYLAFWCTYILGYFTFRCKKYGT